MYRAGPRDVVAGGGGALKAKVLNRAAKAASAGESMRGVETPLSLEFFFKIYVSENAFQAILKPIFHIL